MSSNAAFLSPSPPSARERDELRAIEERRAQVAWRCYRAASLLLVLAMIVIAVPTLGLAEWAWHIVIGVGVMMTALAAVMMIKGRVGNGLLTLICAWGILPGWVWMAPQAVAQGRDLYQMITSQWSERMGR